MLKESATASLSAAINKYLMLDPDTPTRLQPLIDKVVALKIQPPGLTLFFRGEATQLSLLSEWDGVVDTTITGGPISLAQMNVSPTSPLRQLMSGNVEITGDTETGQIFQAVLHQVDIPWQRHLAAIVGDALAHQVTQTVRGLRQWGEDSASSMRANITEYLQEEIGQLPPREAVRDFLADVDDLRMTSDRLVARIELLTKNAS
jgi:ubiquinone biosynthesis protein UbiJ